MALVARDVSTLDYGLGAVLPEAVRLRAGLGPAQVSKTKYGSVGKNKISGPTDTPVHVGEERANEDARRDEDHQTREEAAVHETHGKLQTRA